MRLLAITIFFLFAIWLRVYFPLSSSSIAIQLGNFQFDSWAMGIYKTIFRQNFFPSSFCDTQITSNWYRRKRSRNLKTEVKLYSHRLKKRQNFYLILAHLFMHLTDFQWEMRWKKISSNFIVHIIIIIYYMSTAARVSTAHMVLRVFLFKFQFLADYKTSIVEHWAKRFS